MKKSAYYPFFKKLASPLRIAIVSSLAKREKTVNELAKELNVEQSKLSHALSALAGCSIVASRRKGKKKIYSVNKTIPQILNLIDSHSQKCCKVCSYRK